MAKTRWDYAVELVLVAEGGVSNHPADHGGLTNMGITQATYDAYRSLMKRPRQSVRQLTRAEAMDCYQKMYWDKCGAGACKLPLAVMLFDMAVNSGPTTAVKYMQVAAGVVSDGVIGPATKAALAKLDQTKVALQMVELRRNFYKRIIARDSSQKVFERGWMNRINHLEHWIKNLTDDEEDLG